MITIDSENIPIKMWLGKIEPKAETQARNLANLSVAFRHIAIMPDAHVGYGMPIGGVLATIDAVVPNAVGVDIGCGMVAAKSSLKEIGENILKKILGELRKKIPVGFEHHKKPQKWEGFEQAPDVPIIQQELASARRQIGTLGGGNHFLEILQEVGDERWGIKGEGNIWLMLHSGSRNFGLKVANFYHRKAQQFCERNSVALPDQDLAFLALDSEEGQEYWQAMNYCLNFARANRDLMIKRFMEIFIDITGEEFVLPHPNPLPSAGSGQALLKERGKDFEDGKPYIGIHHNYAAREEHFGKEVIIHRKGATAAFTGQLGIVPGSMGTPSFIVEGLGNPESFKSCSHGAGRQMSRREANKKISKKEAERAIAGVLFGRWHGKFDEAPQAYKNIEEVMEQQKDLAWPIVKLKPLAVVIGN